MYVRKACESCKARFEIHWDEHTYGMPVVPYCPLCKENILVEYIMREHGAYTEYTADYYNCYTVENVEKGAWAK